MRQRTRRFALRVVKLTSELPQNRFGDTIGRQLLRCGTSVGANYAEATSASSRKHFVSLVEIAAREARETLYWLELLSDCGTFPERRIGPIRQECNELVSILVASSRTARRSQ